jgi:hypothetical protein
MARICYVILAHNEPINLIGLLGSLWNREDAFSIWIDAKADEDFVRVANTLTGFADNAKICLGRVMSWGGFSVVDTTLMAYSALRNQIGDFSHVILCSGTHIPLLHPDLIYERIRNVPGWMDFCEISIPEGGLVERDMMPPGWVRNILTRVRYRYTEVPFVGMIPAEERQNWIGLSVLEGSQWHVLRSDIIDSIVANQAEIRDKFRDVLVPDEHAFQWAVSKFRPDRELRRGDHVFMRWQGASPKRLSFADAAEIAALGRFLFARKVQTECVAADWIAWAQSCTVANTKGARRLEDISASLHLDLQDRRVSAGTVQDEKVCDQLFAALVAEISSALGGHVKAEKRTGRRYLIDSGKQHSLGGHVFLLGFAEASLGLSVVPALRRSDLRDDNRMRLQPGPPYFAGEFVNILVEGHASWSIGVSDTGSDCKALTNSIFSG